MRSTFRILFYINRNKAKKNGKAAVLCRITVDGRSAVIATGEECAPEAWQTKTGGTGEKKINLRLQALRERIEASYTTLLRREGVVSVERLKLRLQGVNETSTMLLETSTEELRTVEACVGRSKSPSTYQNDCRSDSGLRNFVRSRGESDIPIPTLAPDFFEAYRFYLKRRGKDLSAQIDIKENPYTGNSISLHEESIPYRLHGKGSKRLMSMAVQLEMTKQGGIVLIDELEQGLEPDRIVSLVRKLKQTSSGQVFITTHSLNVILEASSQNLFVLNKGCRTLSVVDESLDQCRRTNPQAFFAKKIICCEGKTEQGFIRSLDAWLLKERNTSLSAKGVVIVNAGGGDKMYTYAVKLKSLGYNTCVFADDDKPQELASSKNSATEAEVSLFLCEEGNCIEQQLFMDLPWEYVIEMVNCDEDGFPNKHIQTTKDGLKAKINDADNDEDQYNIRRELAKLSTTKGREWFKHIPGGEFLGLIFTEAYDKIDAEKGIKSTINELLTWCDIPDERLERLY